MLSDLSSIYVLEKRGGEVRSLQKINEMRISRHCSKKIFFEKNPVSGKSTNQNKCRLQIFSTFRSVKGEIERKRFYFVLYYEKESIMVYYVQI